MKFEDTFPTPKPIIAMLHTTCQERVSGYNNALDVITKRALEELAIFEEEGIDGVIVENYFGESPQMAIDLLERVMQAGAGPRIKVGLNILPNEYEQAILESADKGANFVQVDYVAGQYNEQINWVGDINGYREARPEIMVLGGVWPKYYTPIPGSDLDADLKNGMLNCDAIVVTGKGTGKETPVQKIKRFRRTIRDFPLIQGAGLNIENAHEHLRLVDGDIVGSGLKYENNVRNKVDRARVKDLVQIAADVRRQYSQQPTS